MSPKAKRGIATRQAILNHLNGGAGGSTLAELALALREPRKVILGHLNIMIAAGEVRSGPGGYEAVARKTAVFVHGGAVKKPPTRMVNLCARKMAIKNQGGQGAAGPRQATARGLY